MKLDRLLSVPVGLRARRDAARAIRSAAASPVHAGRPVLMPLLRSLAKDCHTQLDVGTGLMHSLERSPCPVRIGLDAHRPYLEHRRLRDVVPLHASALSIEKLFVKDAVDLLTLIDVLEHFEREDAVRLLGQAETVARQRVVLFTPRGAFPQEDHDAFGLGGEELQRHRSAWEPEDLTGLGYNVVVMDGYHGPWNESFLKTFGPEAKPIDALVAWKEPNRSHPRGAQGSG
jgi:hypothetical protein